MCSRCERRFAQPAVLEWGRCPLCDGKLVSFAERPNPNLLERPVKDSVSENGSR